MKHLAPSLALCILATGLLAQLPKTSVGGGAGGSGTVTSVGLAGTANQITVTGATPITGAGAWTLSFPAGGVTLPGTTSGAFKGNLTGDVTGNVSGSAGSATGNAGTATALAANGANCSAGNYPLGVDASGAVESCTAVPATHTQNTDTGTTGTDFAIDSDNTGPRMKNAAGTLEVRNAADDAYAPLKASSLDLVDSGGAAGAIGLTQGTACTAGANEVCIYVPASVTAFGLLLPGAVGSTGVVKVSVSGSVATYSHAALVDNDIPDTITASNYAPLASPVFSGTVDAGGAELEVPNGASPTTDGVGEVGVDTTTDQFQFYGAAERALPSVQFLSIVVAAPVDTDDFNVLKAPYGMTLIGVSCIVQGTTSITGQLQECDSAGANCADTDSGGDITCDADGAADDGTLSNASIDANDWIQWKSTSASGTPTFLTITARYYVVPD